MTTEQAHDNFYQYALAPHRSELKIFPSDSQGTFMIMLQRQHYRRLYNIPRPQNPSKSPFLTTLHARMRTVQQMKKENAYNDVYAMLRRIQSLANWREIPDVLKELHDKGAKGVFSLEYDPDLEHPEQQILYFRIQEKTFLDGKPHHQYVQKLFQAFDVKWKQISISNFETDLTRSLPAKHHLQSPLACFNPLSRDELTGDLTWISWYLLPQPVERLSLDSPSYFRALGRLMSRKGQLARWKFYLTFLWLHYVANLFEDTRNLFYHHVGRKDLGQLKPVPEWYHRVELTSAAWWQDASLVFLQSDRPYLEKARDLVTHMTDDLKDALKSVFKTAAWDPPTRYEALRKLENMEFLIGWSDRKFKRPQEVPDKDTPFDVAIMTGFEHQFNLQWWNDGRPTDARQWRWVPYGEVNAFYSRELNTLFLPASLFYPPYLNMGPGHTPENYGAMGSIIAHELFHGFDYDSKEVSAEGTLRQWWTRKDRKQFDANVKKTIKLYSKCRDISGNRKMDGRLTLSENIADLVSLRLAWNAFTTRWHYDHDASPPEEAVYRFFNMFALSQVQIYRPQILKTVIKHDFHALAEARVNLPLSTFKPFLQSYDVRRGDPMFTPSVQRPQFLAPRQRSH